MFYDVVANHVIYEHVILLFYVLYLYLRYCKVQLARSKMTSFLCNRFSLHCHVSCHVMSCPYDSSRRHGYVMGVN